MLYPIDGILKNVFREEDVVGFLGRIHHHFLQII